MLSQPALHKPFFLYSKQEKNDSRQVFQHTFFRAAFRFILLLLPLINLTNNYVAYKL
jgi:hypothetical protein